MKEPFAQILTAGGHANSLGRTNEAIQLVLDDTSRLPDLYNCLFDPDAWVRMRAADALEKICRNHPDWLLPYIDKLLADLSASDQASIQWHLAQIYRQAALSPQQKQAATQWLKNLLATPHADWIVAANAMDTLAEFCKQGYIKKDELLALIAIQQQHTSKSVVRRASKLHAQITQGA